jgi:hypothetical protein
LPGELLPAQLNGIDFCMTALFVALSYKWKHNTFVSIAAGTVLYMVLQGMLGRM